jgi:hypothetical protein
MLRILYVMALAAGAANADDTADFLKPENWKGLEGHWKLDAAKKTITGITEKDPKFNTFYCSQAEYADFELSFKVRIKGGIGNSGVQIRSEVVDKEKFVVAGPQCDMGQQYWGSLYGERVGGMMKASPAEKVKEKVKAADWNDYFISVKGDHVLIKVNGEAMVDDNFKMLPDKKANKPMAAKGIIAFQLHQGPPMTVEFTEIAFKKK